MFSAIHFPRTRINRAATRCVPCTHRTQGFHVSMFFRMLSAAAAISVFSSTLALADAAREAAQRCAIQTNAPGNYNISNAPGLPNVIPGAGGTAAGAANMNDCLADVYGVQYGARGAIPATTAATDTATALAACERTRNRHIAGGVAATIGVIAALGEPYSASIIGGAIGTTRGMRGVNKRYSDCVARVNAPAVDPNAAIQTGCSRRGGVMSQGTRLCIAP